MGDLYALSADDTRGGTDVPPDWAEWGWAAAGNAVGTIVGGIVLAGLLVAIAELARRLNTPEARRQQSADLVVWLRVCNGGVFITGLMLVVVLEGFPPVPGVLVRVALVGGLIFVVVGAFELMVLLLARLLAWTWGRDADGSRR